jgi:hypothetical protein
MSAVTDWCATVAADFRWHEADLVTVLHGDRDAALVEYTLRALADPGVDGGSRVLEIVDRQRAVALTRLVAVTAR